MLTCSDTEVCPLAITAQYLGYCNAVSWTYVEKHQRSLSSRHDVTLKPGLLTCSDAWLAPNTLYLTPPITTHTTG